MLHRVFEIFVAIILLFVLSPVLIILISLVYFMLGSPIFFKQERIGLNEKIFTLYKFRTMDVAFDDTGVPLSDEKRTPWFGQLLRSTSLDELPSILNVIFGDMSFVGPRPLLKEYLPLYSKSQRLRHTTRPGITGWAQINGRNSLTWTEKFSLDVWYVKNKSFLLDIKIIFLTIFKVIRREGINQSKNITSVKFNGKN